MKRLLCWLGFHQWIIYEWDRWSENMGMSKRYSVLTIKCVNCLKEKKLIERDI
jgi:hypothetical protein